ncbi:MAG: hypothetical protein IPI58_06630 [Alphaproteobacteria bacterium]|nr:MAG: hypothetical protein IPI58_06630 [Alphaproteobacteria bacterium]
MPAYIDHYWRCAQLQPLAQALAEHVNILGPLLDDQGCWYGSVRAEYALPLPPDCEDATPEIAQAVLGLWA